MEYLYVVHHDIRCKQKKGKQLGVFFHFFYFYFYLWLVGLLSCHWMKEWEYGKIRDDKIG